MTTLSLPTILNNIFLMEGASLKIEGSGDECNCIPPWSGCLGSLGLCLLGWGLCVIIWCSNATLLLQESLKDSSLWLVTSLCQLHLMCEVMESSSLQREVSSNVYDYIPSWHGSLGCLCFHNQGSSFEIYNKPSITMQRLSYKNCPLHDHLFWMRIWDPYPQHFALKLEALNLHHRGGCLLSWWPHLQKTLLAPSFVFRSPPLFLLRP